VPGLAAAAGLALVLVGAGLVGFGAGDVVVGCGAGLVVVGFGAGLADFDGVGVADGDPLGVEEYVVATYGVGVGLWWWCRVGLSCTATCCAGRVGDSWPARAVVPMRTPARDPPTALTPATVSEPRRSGPP
jgi:hypothetical protein